MTVVLLLLVFGFPAINGARRWIRISGFSFQPSELAKIALPIFLAYYLTKKEEFVGDLRRGRCSVSARIWCFGGACLSRKGPGYDDRICAIFSAVYFAAGARLVHIGTVAASMAAVGVGAILFAPWRVARLMAFLDPYKYADDEGYQVVQSLYAIGSGGVFGEGFAKGHQKLFYLPYPYSDFIFSVVGEELGLIGTLAVRDCVRLVVVARSTGGGVGSGQVWQSAWYRNYYRHYRAGSVQYQRRDVDPAGQGNSAAVYFVRRIVGGVTLIGVGILLNISKFAGSGAIERR